MFGRKKKLECSYYRGSLVSEIFSQSTVFNVSSRKNPWALVSNPGGLPTILHPVAPPQERNMSSLHPESTFIRFLTRTMVVGDTIWMVMD